jgi:hypothetical protein
MIKISQKNLPGLQFIIPDRMSLGTPPSLNGQTSNVKSSIVEEQIFHFVFFPSIVEERILRFVFVPSIVEEQILWFVFIPSIV